MSKINNNIYYKPDSKNSKKKFVRGGDTNSIYDDNKFDNNKFNDNNEIDCNQDVNWSVMVEQDGCENNQVYGLRVVKPGSLIDRFGPPNGGFFAPIFNHPFTYSSRSIPYIIHSPMCESEYDKAVRQQYHVYKVIKEFIVFECGAAPFKTYGTEGGAHQYFLKNSKTQEYSSQFIYDKNKQTFIFDDKRNQIKSVSELETQNYIQEIQPTSYPDFGVFHGGSKRRKQKPTHRKKISKRRKNKTKKIKKTKQK